MIITEYVTNYPRSEWGDRFHTAQISAPVKASEAFVRNRWEQWELDLCYDRNLTAAEISERTGRTKRSIYQKRTDDKRRANGGI